MAPGRNALRGVGESQEETKMTLYMNIATGSVDDYDNWYYDDDATEWELGVAR